MLPIVRLEHPGVVGEHAARPPRRARAFALWHPSLFIGRLQVAPCALLFDDQHARQEQVDEAGTIVELGNVLLVAGNLTTAFPEDLKELVVEALRLALLVGRFPLVVRERGSTGADFVPRQAHQSTLLDSKPRGECSATGQKLHAITNSSTHDGYLTRNSDARMDHGWNEPAHCLSSLRQPGRSHFTVQFAALSTEARCLGEILLDSQSISCLSERTASIQN